MTWLLLLNPMQGRAEACAPVARAENREALERFVAAEIVEPYVDDNRWHKSFRKGGPLEWFNPPSPGYENPWFREIVDVGTKEEWTRRAAARAAEDYELKVMQVQEVKELPHV